MLILGFESTAHTFGAAVVESRLDAPKKNGKQKSHFSNPSNLTPKNTKIISETDMKFPALKEGFIPRKLADFHAKNFDEILGKTLDGAKISLSDLDAVCYSYGPGIGHSLHIGYMASKTISITQNIPLVPVNHALAHIEIARFHSGFSDPLALYVSGGNTQVLELVENEKKSVISKNQQVGKMEGISDRNVKNHLKHYHILGETLDIGLGNFLDQVGRHFNLSPPDAVGVLKQASEGKNLLDLPYVIKGMNTSYSGMLTCVKKLDLKKFDIADICLSSQEYAFSMFLEASERALALTTKKSLVGVGGNFRNKRLQEMTLELAKEHDIKCHFPSFELLGDNSGMIAITGALKFATGVFSKNVEPNQRARIDEELVGW